MNKKKMMHACHKTAYQRHEKAQLWPQTLFSIKCEKLPNNRNNNSKYKCRFGICVCVCVCAHCSILIDNGVCDCECVWVCNNKYMVYGLLFLFHLMSFGSVGFPAILPVAFVLVGSIA